LISTLAVNGVAASQAVLLAQGNEVILRVDPGLSAVSAFERNLRFAGREDFWIIVAARSEDET
jgi:hypothetical protein